VKRSKQQSSRPTHFFHKIQSDNHQTPYCIVRLPSGSAAKALISRSILAEGIYELWGEGRDYLTLHEDAKRRSSHKWPSYKTCSFRFSIHGYRGKRSASVQRDLIESFSYLHLEGPIAMKNPDVEFHIFELWPPLDHISRAQPVDNLPTRVFLGRLLARSDRNTAAEFSLKKRVYINTTSMDAELALVTANMAHAAPGRVFVDPFVGTGGFCVSVAHFGGVAVGADIDGRMIRGKGEKSIEGNFRQYGLDGLWLDGIVSDLTNSPLRRGTGNRWVDGILCDPPYGIREGCKVLGSKAGLGSEVVIDGIPAHL
jgi:tRNA (guanine10-N2)-methyltransferase